MPFKSEAQRGFMYANHPKLAKEFEEATPEGKKLPEHVAHMAAGGEVNSSDYGTLVGLRELLRKAAEENQDPNFQMDASTATKSMADGGIVPYSGVPKTTRPEMNPIEEAINEIAKRDPRILMHVTTPDGKTAPGVTIGKRFAAGGEVPDFQPVDINAIPGPAQPLSVPPLGELSSAINKTPDTDYNFFKNLSAEDRAALQQKLIAQQNSGPSLIAQGAAGLGDAISNSFGGKNTTFQKDIMANNEAQQAKQMGMIDTERAQKLQDMNANLEMQQNDAKSPLSQSMQRTFKSAGINVPSGMPASMMMKIAPALGELAMKQAAMGMQKQMTDAQQEIARQGQRNAATEARSKMGWWSRNVSHPEEYAALGKAAGMPSEAPAPASFGVGQAVKHPSGATITRIK